MVFMPHWSIDFFSNNTLRMLPFVVMQNKQGHYNKGKLLLDLQQISIAICRIASFLALRFCNLLAFYLIAIIFVSSCTRIACNTVLEKADLHRHSKLLKIRWWRRMWYALLQIICFIFNWDRSYVSTWCSANPSFLWMLRLHSLLVAICILLSIWLGK